MSGRSRNRFRRAPYPSRLRLSHFELYAEAIERYGDGAEPLSSRVNCSSSRAVQPKRTGGTESFRLDAGGAFITFSRRVDLLLRRGPSQNTRNTTYHKALQTNMRPSRRVITEGAHNVRVPTLP